MALTAAAPFQAPIVKSLSVRLVVDVQHQPRRLVERRVVVIVDAGKSALRQSERVVHARIMPDA